jgi:hypothetical protein
MPWSVEREIGSRRNQKELHGCVRLINAGAPPRQTAGDLFI